MSGAGLGVPTINEESSSASALASPDLEEKDDPLEAIEQRETTQHYLTKNQTAAQTRSTGGIQPRSERPRISETESTIPLLSDTSRKDSSESTCHITHHAINTCARELIICPVPRTEELILNTYPPPESSSSTESSIDHTEAAILAMKQAQQRESEQIPTVESASSRRISGEASTSASKTVPPVISEPPLCAFVVDDDKCVVPSQPVIHGRARASADSSIQTDPDAHVPNVDSPRPSSDNCRKWENGVGDDQG